MLFKVSIIVNYCEKFNTNYDKLACRVLKFVSIMKTWLIIICDIVFFIPFKQFTFLFIKYQIQRIINKSFVYRYSFFLRLLNQAKTSSTYRTKRNYGKHDGFILQIIYTTVYRAKRLNNLMLPVRLFNRLPRKIML
jgi:hypothetical protein